MVTLAVASHQPAVSSYRDYQWLQNLRRDVRFTAIMLPVCLSPVFISIDPWGLLGGSDALRPLVAVLFSLVLFAVMYRMYRLTLKAEALRQSLYLQAKLDPLTGLGNRLSFKEALYGEARRADLQRYPISFMLLDVEGLGDINDRQGHKRGDELLLNLARVLRHHARPDVDQIFRIGGDEFAMLLPGLPVQDGFRLMFRIKASFSKMSGSGLGGAEPRCSGGVADRLADEDPEAWYQRVVGLLRQEQGR